jgi:hypothetical protein
VHRRAPTSVLVLLAFAVGAAGCGGDDEASQKPPKPPELTVPRGTRTQQETTGTETTRQTAPSGAPQTEGSGGAPSRSAPQDSPQNDSAPPKGSPAERFERFCDENPGACG